MKTRLILLIIVAVLVLLFPLIPLLQFHMGNQVMMSGFTVSGSIVLLLSIIFSIFSWFLFAWASKNIKWSGIPLSIISGAALMISFHGILGPMAAIIVGVVAGFAAFMLQKKMINPTHNKPLIIAAVTMGAAYFVLIMMFLAVQPTPHVWDTGDGVGARTVTAEGLNLNPDLSPSYALDFSMSLNSVFVVVPIMLGTISLILIIPHLILKKKKIPSRPYVLLIASDIMLFFGIPIIIQGIDQWSLLQPEKLQTIEFVLLILVVQTPGYVLTGIGIAILYKSQLIRRLIRK